MGASLSYPKFRAFKTDNTAAVGWKLYSYAEGTTTPQATYTDATLTTPNANPVILDANGEAAVWPSSAAYKFVLKDNADVTQWTLDAWSAGTSSGSSSVSEWVAFSGAPTYVSATQFTVTGDQTGTLQVNRRLKSTVTAGTIYSSITVSSYSAGITTVTVTNDSGSLDSGLSVISYGLLSATNPSSPVTTATQNEWITETKALVYVSATQFRVSNADVTATYHVGRRIKATVTAGTTYGTITAVSYGAPNTTVTVINDGASALDSGLSAMAYGILSFNNFAFLDPRSYVWVANSTGSQSIGAALTKVTFGTKTTDTLSEFDAVTNYRFTAKRLGTYLITSTVQYSPGSTSSSMIYLYIYKNGTQLLSPGTSRYGVTNAQAESLTATGVVQLAATDYIEVFLSPGVAVTALSGQSFLQVARVI